MPVMTDSAACHKQPMVNAERGKAGEPEYTRAPMVAQLDRSLGDWKCTLCDSAIAWMEVLRGISVVMARRGCHTDDNPGVERQPPISSVVQEECDSLAGSSSSTLHNRSMDSTVGR